MQRKQKKSKKFQRRPLSGQQISPNLNQSTNQIEEHKGNQNEEIKSYEKVIQDNSQVNDKQQQHVQQVQQSIIIQDVYERIGIFLNGKKLKTLKGVEGNCNLRILKSTLNFKFDYYFVSPTAKIKKAEESQYCVAEILGNEGKEIRIEQDFLVIPNKFPNTVSYVSTLQTFLHNEHSISQAIERPLKTVDFEFDNTVTSAIFCRLILQLSKTDNMIEKEQLLIEIPYKDKMALRYTAIGCVYKIQIGAKGHCTVLVDINIRNPDAKSDEGEGKQLLPQMDHELYQSHLQYCILKPNKSFFWKMSTLEKFQKVGKPSTEFIKNAILNCEPHKPISIEQPQDVFVSGLPKILSNSQFKAVQEARVGRMQLIQGPPGTGKTLVTCAIVANWFKMNPEEQILICAPSNATADLIAERLQQIDILANKFIRFYSESEEDLLNLDPEKVKPFSIMHRMVFMTDEQKEEQLILMLNTRHLYDVKQQVEYYFSDFNYYEQRGGDLGMQKLIVENGCVPFENLLQFNRMRYYHMASQYDLNQIAPFGINYELYQNLGFKKRERNINNQITVLCMDINDIRNMSKQNYESIIDKKQKFERRIIDQTPIIITTFNDSCEKLLKDKKFKKVIIDEAAQATEVETLLPIINAKQVVLIGDHKQLGPVIDTKLNGPDSLFKRLIEGGYPHIMLSSQYRMHPFLLIFSNRIFYNDKIENEFNFSFQNFFIHKDRPLLFVDVDDEETRYDRSFYNEGQAVAALLLYKYLTTTRGLKQSQIGVISPYNGQTQKLRELISSDPNVVNTIDQWQGKEQDFIIFTTAIDNAYLLIKNGNTI
eukprot:403359193